MIDPDDLAAFRAAVADIEPLPPVDRVDLSKAKVRQVSRQPTGEQNRPERRPAPSWPSQWQIAEPAQPVHQSPPAAGEFLTFHAAMAGVEPLPPANRAELGKPPPPPRPLQHLADERAALRESLHGPIALHDRLEGGDEPTYLRNGLTAGTLRDLRRGRWVVQEEIDLHGLNRDEARAALATFLAASLQHGTRCVRIVHGKGLSSPGRQSVLRQLVRGWLAQRDEVLAYCQARPQDGGEGALIALLRSTKKSSRNFA